MKIVIQRVSRAFVTVNNNTTGKINRGYVILVGVEENDQEEDAQYLADKITNLRIFEDENKKMNLSIKDVNGEILSISQFTLLASTRKGRRPSFTNAAAPDKGLQLYNYFNNLLTANSIKVAQGIFGEHMDVNLINDGPVTIIIDSKERHLPRR